MTARQKCDIILPLASRIWPPASLESVTLGSSPVRLHQHASECLISLDLYLSLRALYVRVYPLCCPGTGRARFGVKATVAVDI